MKMSSFPRILGFFLLALHGCDADDTAADDCAPPQQPATIGPLLYEVHDCLPTHLCGRAALHRDGERVQLLVFDVDGRVTGEARGVLVSAVAQAFDERIAAIVENGVAVGEFDSECLDGPPTPPVVLNLPTTFDMVGFRHPFRCGPTGLAEMESDLHEVLAYLRDCKDGPATIESCDFDSRPNHE